MYASTQLRSARPGLPLSACLCCLCPLRAECDLRKTKFDGKSSSGFKIVNPLSNPEHCLVLTREEKPHLLFVKWRHLQCKQKDFDVFKKWEIFIYFHIHIFEFVVVRLVHVLWYDILECYFGMIIDILGLKLIKQTSYWSKTGVFSQFKIIFIPK